MMRDSPVERGAGDPGEAPLTPWERKVGAHLIWFEPPDLFGMRPSGDVSGAEVTALLEPFTQLAKQVPLLLGLMDISKLGQLSAGARQVILQWERPQNAATAIYGASFRHRVMLDLLRRAAKLFGREVTTMNFFDAEREARAFLEEHRRAPAGPQRG
jgi:hypothetical protein